MGPRILLLVNSRIHRNIFVRDAHKIKDESGRRLVTFGLEWVLEGLTDIDFVPNFRSLKG
jgi:hypothetical protein